MPRARPPLPDGTTAEGEDRPEVAATVADDASFSIRVTSRLTGIELDTLRMWERRYGFPRPPRTGGGSRIYSESDVEALKLIRRALDQGYRPGEVVGKGRAELMALILATSAEPTREATPGPSRAGARGARSAGAEDGNAPSVASLLAALGEDDVAAVRVGLRQAAVSRGPKGFLRDLVHPISVRVGELWAAGKLEVRHEHMLSECLSAQLRVMMSAYEDGVGAPRVLLATLPDERHGLGLEMIEVYLAVSQITPILLGIDTPPDQIVKAAKAHAVDAVGLLVTHASDLAVASEQIRWLLNELPRRVSIWIGGAAGAELSVRDEALRLVSDWAELDAAIATLARGRA